MLQLKKPVSEQSVKLQDLTERRQLQQSKQLEQELDKLKLKLASHRSLNSLVR